MQRYFVWISYSTKKLRDFLIENHTGFLRSLTKNLSCDPWDFVFFSNPGDPEEDILIKPSSNFQRDFPYDFDRRVKLVPGIQKILLQNYDLTRKFLLSYLFRISREISLDEMTLTPTPSLVLYGYCLSIFNVIKIGIQA